MLSFRTIVFSALFIGLLTNLQAQNESFLGLTLGGALPQGSFAEKDYTSEQSGYANTGFLFTFDGALFPDDYLGFGATVTYASNNPDKATYKADLIDDILTRYPDLEEYKDDIYFDYGVWRYLNFHVGPNITANAGPFNFDVRALAGLSLAWPPGHLLQIKVNEEETFSRKITSKATPALGYTVGGGIRYAMKSGYVIRFIAEYSNCKPTFDVIESVDLDASGNIQEETTEISMPFKNIQLGIGIAYNFEL
jgi:opacity protein-like surface antigen